MSTGFLCFLVFRKSRCLLLAEVLNFLRLFVEEKIIQECIGEAQLRSVVAPENSCRSLNQSDVKLKQITIWSPAFSRTLGNCLALTLSFEFSLALKDIFLQFKFWLNDTQPKSTPYRIIQTCNSLKLKSSNLYQ